MSYIKCPGNSLPVFANAVSLPLTAPDGFAVVALDTDSIYVFNAGSASWVLPIEGGTVTSVGLSMPAIFSVSGSPVTSSGTLTASLVTQAANIVFAGPTTGAATAPTFRSLVNADIPSTLSSKTFDNTNTVTLKDTLFTLQDDGDVTKQLTFQLSGITTGTTRTLTIPDSSGTVALTANISNETEDARSTTTETLTLSDLGQFVTLSNASATVLTVPTNASVAFPIGSRVDLLQIGAGQVTVTAAGGVTLLSSNGLKLRAQYSAACLWKQGTNTWYLMGDTST